MMLKCARCGAAWTSLGLPICPMCGARVEPPAGVSESGRHERIVPPKPNIAETSRPVLQAALSMPQQLGRYVPQMAVQAPTAPPPRPPAEPLIAKVSIPPETAMYRPQVAAPPKDPTPIPARKDPMPPPLPVVPPKPPAVKAPPIPPVPTPARSVAPLEIDHAASAISDFGFDQITINPAPPVEKPSPRGEDDSWYCSLPVPAAPPPKRGEPVLRQYAPIRPATPPPARTTITELVDASVLVDRIRPLQGKKALPAPARPLTAPLVLGVVAVLAGLLVPLTAALERNRIVGVLGFCVCGLLLPLAPLAWIAGLAAEQRRREQGLRVERRVVVGRLLGQWGTLLLAAEGAIAYLIVAAFRVVGRLP